MTPSARQPRMPAPLLVFRFSVSSTSLPPLRSPTVLTRRAVNPRSLSMILVVVLSMFLSYRLTMVSSKYLLLQVILTSVVKTLTTVSSTTSSSCTRRRPVAMSPATSAPLASSSAKLKRPRGHSPASSQPVLNPSLSRTVTTFPRRSPVPSSKNPTWISSTRL